MRRVILVLGDLILPGVGHVADGRRRAGLVFLAPVALLVAVVAVLVASGGPLELVKVLVTPGVLPALALLNVVLAAWRIVAAVDTARLGAVSARATAFLVAAGLVVVVLPHAFVGGYVASVSAFLDSAFAGDEEHDPADAETDPLDMTDTPSPVPSTPSPTSSRGATPSASATARPTATPSPAPTPRPTPSPRSGRSSGTGTLPGLNVTVPWTRPREVPWGTDGRFDLLLLGSDAGTDRWSRRMDVMLLVEVDVSSGRVALVGIPRNLVNAPFPPGAARNAVRCGCFEDLLNALYVEATERHPSRWPGAGAVSGIGAVRAVVSELTGRPVDAVLVADLWGVIKVVDAMGGIDIDVPAAVHDDNYPDPVRGSIVLDIRKGRQHMDGRTALAYARSRHQDSDYGRMARQQTLLLAIRSQLDAGVILEAPALLDAAQGFTWTDLPRSSLPNLVDLFARADTASVKQLRIVPPRYGSHLTSAEIARIRRDVAALLGTP